MSGGPFEYGRRVAMMSAMQSHPELKNRTDFWMIPIEDQYRDHLRVFREFNEKVAPQFGYTLRYRDINYAEIVLPSLCALNAHYYLFCNALKNLASDAQLAEWMIEVKAMRMFGCYVITELAHGSDV